MEHEFPFYLEATASLDWDIIQAIKKEFHGNLARAYHEMMLSEPIVGVNWRQENVSRSTFYRVMQWERLDSDKIGRIKLGWWLYYDSHYPKEWEPVPIELDALRKWIVKNLGSLKKAHEVSNSRWSYSRFAAILQGQGKKPEHLKEIVRALQDYEVRLRIPE